MEAGVAGRHLAVVVVVDFVSHLHLLFPRRPLVKQRGREVCFWTSWEGQIKRRQNKRCRRTKVDENEGQGGSS